MRVEQNMTFLLEVLRESQNETGLRCLIFVAVQAVQENASTQDLMMCSPSGTDSLSVMSNRGS